MTSRVGSSPATVDACSVFPKEAALSPLTDLCAKCSPAFIADFVQRGNPLDEHKRAKLLCYLVMYGAADFVNGSLNPQKSELWTASPSLLADTNKDVLTAETIVWLCFLMGRFWTTERDYEMRQRVGYLTLTHTNQLCLALINDATGVDFKVRFVESRKLYLDAQKERGDLYEAFIGRLLACLGSKSVVESPSASHGLKPEGTQLAMAVMIFFSTMPEAIYKNFMTLLHERSDEFPWDPEL